MSKALDKKMGWADIARGVLGEMKDLLASALTDEQKLDQIKIQLEADVAKLRTRAREIGGQMRALADPETTDLEPLEALKARRQKLVVLGAGMVDKTRSGKKLAAIADEIKGLDRLIAANQETYDTLHEAYGIAKGNYQAALEALERVRGQGTAILSALAAQKDAQEMRDKARDSTSIDTSFVDDLMGELSQSKAEARADADLDADLDATNGFNIDAALKADDDAEVDASIMEEFRTASKKAA